MKKVLKRLMVLFLVIAIVYSFAGCASDIDGTSVPTTDVSITTTTTNEDSESIVSDDEAVTTATSTEETSTVVESITETTSETPARAQTPEKTENVSTTETTEPKKNDSTPSITDSKETNTKPSKEKDDSKQTPSAPATTPTVTTPKFDKHLNVYEHKNIETTPGSDNYVAYMSVYCVSDNADNKAKFENEFKEAFGFLPTAKIKSTYIGEFLVEGYEGAQKVFQYSIEDRTYPLITDEFYVVKKKICADGSGWCGFPVPCSMDNMDNSQRVQNLLTEMRKMFCDWYGVDYSYISANSDKFMVNMISEAGFMRTEDGQVLNVIYRYIRGVNMPI